MRSSLRELTAEPWSMSPNYKGVSVEGATQRITNGVISWVICRDRYDIIVTSESGSPKAEKKIHTWGLRSEVREDASFFAGWGAGRRVPLRQPQQLEVERSFLPLSLWEEDNWCSACIYLFGNVDTLCV